MEKYNLSVHNLAFIRYIEHSKEMYVMFKYTNCLIYRNVLLNFYRNVLFEIKILFYFRYRSSIQLLQHPLNESLPS